MAISFKDYLAVAGMISAKPAPDYSMATSRLRHKFVIRIIRYAYLSLKLRILCLIRRCHRYTRSQAVARIADRTAKIVGVT